MKKADYPRLKDEVLKMLPVHQQDVWKIMHISHQDMSDVMKLLIEEKLIKRTPVTKNRQRTYLIELLNPKIKLPTPKIIKSRIHKKKSSSQKSKKQEKNDFSSLLVGGLFSPCTGCVKDCKPTDCESIMDWVFATGQ